MNFHFSPRPNRAAEIHWREWSPEAFAEAEASDRLIVLSLSAVWCHWCHVMDETTYSTDAVIQQINAEFVAIRVDADERPDINVRYNMGGWPTTAVLTPRGEVLSGSTYVPPGSMLSLLERVRTFYATQRSGIAQHLAHARSARLSRAAEPVAASELDPRIVGDVLSLMTEAFDEEHGGFGDAPKFPQPQVLRLLLAVWRVARMEEQRTNRSEVRPGIVTNKSIFGDAASKYEAMLRATLSGMLYGGMYDHQEGGFYRYATQADWSVPHFEKMTEDHAGLLAVIAGTYRVTGDKDLADVMRQTWRYLHDTLYDPSTHLFGGSQDADESYSALDAEARKTHSAPYVDRTSYSHATAALAGSLFEVSEAIRDSSISACAVLTLDALHDRVLDERGLLRHSFADNQASQRPERYLADQVAYLHALITAYEYSGEARFIARAAALADATIETFAHGDRFRDHVGSDGLGSLGDPEFFLPENSLAADALLRLAQAVAADAYRRRAERTLLAFASGARDHGLFAATYGQALSRALSVPTSMTIHAEGGAGEAFRRSARALPDPYLTVKQEAAPEGDPFAVLCRAETCGPPIHDIAVLRASWDKLVALSP